MNENFVFAASVVCLLVGLMLCYLPARRYLKLANIGIAGGLFLVCGIVLMTTFKWTEVAIKISGLEVKLADAEQNATTARIALNVIQNAVSPQVKSQSLEAVLANYKKVSNSDPTPAQLADFKQALDDAAVTIVPLEAFSAIGKFNPPNGGQKK